MASYVSDGEFIDYTPGAAVAEGAVVVIGNIIGVATKAIAANTLGAICVEGVVSMAKDGAAITLGATVYWDATNSVVTATAGSNKTVGKCVKAAAAGDANALVRLSM